MIEDPTTLTNALEIALLVAAFFATLFPILYAFSRWYTTLIGKILMFHAIAMAWAIDLNALFIYWMPEDIIVYYWLELTAFVGVAVAKGLICFAIIKYNYVSKENVRGTGLPDQQ